MLGIKLFRNDIFLVCGQWFQQKRAGCFFFFLFNSDECFKFIFLERKTSLFIIWYIILFFISLIFKYLTLWPFVLVYKPGILIQMLSNMSLRIVAKFSERFPGSYLHQLGVWCPFQIPEEDPVPYVPQKSAVIQL